jgi:hypothetical protein
MLSSGGNVIIWDKMLSSGMKSYHLEIMLSSGTNCYHLGWKCYHLGQNVIIWDENVIIWSGTTCYHLGLHVIIWDAMLSSGAYVIIWDKMLSSGANTIIVSSGAHVILWCYHVMLSSGMLTHPFFIFPENFTHSKALPLSVLQPGPVPVVVNGFLAKIGTLEAVNRTFRLTLVTLVTDFLLYPSKRWSPHNCTLSV